MKSLTFCMLGMLALTAHANELRPWTEYRTVLWFAAKAHKQSSNPDFHQRLRQLGINSGMVGPGGNPSELINAGFFHYVENMISPGLCLKFRSNVTNWSKFIDQWKVDRAEAGLIRDYSLEDPRWRKEVLGEMRRLAAHHRAYHPLAYDIRDELSVTVSANPFDYDFAPVSLAAFREWLKTQYPSVDALNTEWQTTFAKWEDVKPFTSDQIKHRMGTGQAEPAAKVEWDAARRARFDAATAFNERSRWNFSPWADHRTYMDQTLAKTLDDLRQAAREVDPRTPVGVEGTQMPHAFGGYDLWDLSQALDWVEPYDICNSREIFGSFMPGKPILCTVFEKSTQTAERRLWHLLLEGDRGCIVWSSDDVIDWSRPDLPLTEKGAALAPVLKSLTEPLARLFLLAERERDPIALHYSQPSIQVAWLLESAADGPTWVRRFSSFEADHNRHALVRNGWMKALQDLGFSPGFVSSHQITEGGLPDSLRVLVLPQSWAMSDSELAAARSLAEKAGGLVLSDGECGLFEQHAKLRNAPPAVEGVRKHSLSGYPAARLAAAPDFAALNAVAADLAAIGLKAPVQVPLEARVRVHRFKAGPGARLIALERNIEYKMREELAQAGGNEALEQLTTFTAKWDKPGFVYDLRTGESLGHKSEVQVNLDPWQPALFAILDTELPVGNVVRHLLEPLVRAQP